MVRRARCLGAAWILFALAALHLTALGAEVG